MASGDALLNRASEISAEIAEAKAVPNERGYTMDGGKTVGTVRWSRTLKDDAGEVLARTEDGLPFAAVRAFGKGLVFVCGADFGHTYENAAQYKHAELMLAGLDRLYVPIVRVKEIVLQPAGRKLDFKWSGKSATVEIARLDLYDILEIR